MDGLPYCRHCDEQIDDVDGIWVHIEGWATSCVQNATNALNGHVPSLPDLTSFGPGSVAQPKHSARRRADMHMDDLEDTKIEPWSDGEWRVWIPPRGPQDFEGDQIMGPYGDSFWQTEAEAVAFVQQVHEDEATSAAEAQSLRDEIVAKFRKKEYDPEPRNPQPNFYSGDSVRDLQDIRDAGRPGL